jgi:hypothetical protein
MAANDLYLLDELRAERRKMQAPGLSDETFFDSFVAELVTQDYQLPGPEYLQYGIVDGGQDCGIDGIYTFINGTLMTDDSPMGLVGRAPDLDLVILQCKTSAGFSEQPWEKLAVYLPKLLLLGREEEQVARFANTALVAATKRFIKTYKELAPKRPKLSIRIFYATRGDAPSDGVVLKAEMARRALAELFRDATIDIRHLGCAELVDLARRPAQADRVLQIAEVPLTGDSGYGYVCLVKLQAYYEMIKDQKTGRLDAALFEANVRDHEGDSDVNTAISTTLAEASPPYDFWWLNNGVTIVVDDITVAGKQLTLFAPQIVNGLQTSTEIFRHFNNGGDGGDRHLLVRITKASDTEIRDRIIRATNSQNELPLSALRATEKIQRDIEQFLRPRNYFYDRRRNYYRTHGYDEQRVVSMAFLGHAVVSTLLQRPDLARKYPSTLLNDDAHYARIFSEQYPLPMFQRAIWLLRSVQSALMEMQEIRGTSVEDWQYHVTCVAAVMLTRKARPTAADIAGLDVARLKPERVHDLREIVAIEYEHAIPRSGNWTFDKISTDESVTTRIVKRAESFLRSVQWRQWPQQPVDKQYAIRASDVFYTRITGG